VLGKTNWCAEKQDEGIHLQPGCDHLGKDFPCQVRLEGGSAWEPSSSSPEDNGDQISKEFEKYKNHKQENRLYALKE
jgi:hypothetical protein